MVVKAAAVLFRAALTVAPPKLKDVAPVLEVHPHRVLLPLQFRFRFLHLGRCKESGQGSRVRGMRMALRPRITTLCVNSRDRNHNCSNNPNDKYFGNNSRRSGLYRQTFRRPTPSAIHPRSYPRTTGISPHSTFPSQPRRRRRQRRWPQNHHGSVLTVDCLLDRGYHARVRCLYRLLRRGFRTRFRALTRSRRMPVRCAPRTAGIDRVS
jgi:hypothetical protein